MIKRVLWLLLLTLNLSYAETNIVNLYQWSGYLPTKVLQKFTQETGIHVNSNHFDSNEALYTKLKAMPHHGYDVIMPSSYAVHRMIQEDMLEPLDHTRLDNKQALDPALLNQGYDPNNQYSLPYLFNASGLVVHQEYYTAQSLNYWSLLWEPRFKNKLLLLDDVRELFAIALLTLGHSINTQDSNQIKSAYTLLRQLLPNVRTFNSEGLIDLYATEELTIGTGWSGDIYQANQLNPCIQFIYPKEGYVLSIENLAIPKQAIHKQAAYQLINFLSRPDVAALIARETGYPTANKQARNYLPKDMQLNPMLYPDNLTLKRGIVPLSVEKAAVHYEKYWEQLKLEG